MKAIKLIEILTASYASIHDCTLAIIKATKNESKEGVRDAFAVALGTGVLDEPYVERLFAAFDQISDLTEVEEIAVSLDPPLATLRAEVENLRSQFQASQNQQRHVASLQEYIARFEQQWDASRLKAAALKNEIEALRSQIQKIDAIAEEVIQ